MIIKTSPKSNKQGGANVKKERPKYNTYTLTTSTQRAQTKTPKRYDGQ